MTSGWATSKGKVSHNLAFCFVCTRILILFIGIYPAVYGPVYTATKHAVLGYTKAFAVSHYKGVGVKLGWVDLGQIFGPVTAAKYACCTVKYTSERHNIRDGVKTG